jgi:hypothetical protein
VTVVDFSEENGREVASLVQKEHKKFHGDLGVPPAIFIKCDVSNSGKSFVGEVCKGQLICLSK